MAELVQQLELLWPHSAPSVVTCWSLQQSCPWRV